MTPPALQQQDAQKPKLLGHMVEFMTVDIRNYSAKYYDLSSNMPDDITFYMNAIPSRDSTILELGCGTGTCLSPTHESLWLYSRN